MQNYMISSRKRNGVCPSETVEDRVAKDFRSVVRAREEQRAQRRAAKMMYTASAVLILVMLIMGVTTVNNFDKLKAVQSALDLAKSGVETDESANNSAPNSGENGSSVQNVDGTSAEGSDGQNGKSPDASGDNETAAVSSGAVTAVTEESEGTTGTIGQEEAAGNGTESEQSENDGANGSNGVYVVEKGDTLAIISKKMYGDVSHVDSICKMNGLSDGNLIYIGQKLVLP